MGKTGERVKRESKGERFGNSRGSNGGFIRSWSPEAGLLKKAVSVPGPYLARSGETASERERSGLEEPSHHQLKPQRSPRPTASA